MKAAVLYKPFDMRIEDVDVPQISAREVLVRVKRVGVCGSDVHFYCHGRIGSFIVDRPLILGHECSGEAVEVGKDVKNISVGERVVVEPGFTCGVCEYCRSGRYNLCPSVRFYGAPPYNGAFAEYVSAPAENVYSMPKNMTYEEGAMIEPLAVGLMAAKRGGVSVYDSVAIFGAGPIGLLALQAAKSHGVIDVFSIDIVDYRLNRALKMGAKSVINASRENIVEQIMDLTNNRGVDVVIEASGSPRALQQALDVVKPGGRIVLVGYPLVEVPLAVDKILMKELDIRGVHRYANVFPTAIKIVSSGMVDVKSLVTHVFPLERIVEGFNVHMNKIGDPIKVQIEI
ncbi:MAG: NAD(P)-dependent alcohol dehydrogenase [Candidatus Bathyarchaeota archaeon]|nr:NAD(P)-dependent alcohol dehydrogenase [Candidatus Bathyarchaeota archaeon]